MGASRTEVDRPPSVPHRLSPLDAAFLYFERPNELLHVGCIAEIADRVAFEDVVALIEERLCRRLRRYRERPQRGYWDLEPPCWQLDPSFDVRRHVRHIAVPAPGGPAELHALIDALHAAPLDPRHPLWEAYLIDGLTDHSSVLFFKVHHCMVDGVSGAQILELVTDDLVPAPPVATMRLPRAADGPSTVAAGAGSLLGKLPGPATILGGARDIGEALTTLASLLWEPSLPLPFNGPLSDRRTIGWTTLPFDELLAARAVVGCKVNDVLLAIVAGALRRCLGARGLPTNGRARAIVPVSVRREQDHLKLGNLVTAMLPRLPLDEADPVARLRRVAAEMQDLKDRGQPRAAGALLALLGKMPAPVEALFGRLAPDGLVANTICTNVPGPRQPRALLGSRVRAVHPIVPLFQRMGLEFAFLSYADTVSITATADPDLVPDVREITDALAASAKELFAAVRTVPHGDATGTGGVLRVADLMTRDVATVAPGDSLLVAHRSMRDRRIRHLPVVDGDGRLRGIVSQRDILAAESSSLTRHAEPARTKILGAGEVSEIMETHLCTAAAGEPVADAAERMVRHKIGCLPVVDDAGSLVGILTESDLVLWASRQLRTPDAGPAIAAASR